MNLKVLNDPDPHTFASLVSSAQGNYSCTQSEMDIVIQSMLIGLKKGIE